MKLSYEYGTETIEFAVEYRKRKTLSIVVEAPRAITVIAPVGSTEDRIMETVKAKSKWIIQKLFEIKEMEYRKRNKEYINGESFIYMGRNYSLQIVVNETIREPETKLSKGKFFVTVPSKSDDAIKLALENWYKDKAKEKIAERIAYYQPSFDINPKRLVIKDQQKRWGSCTKSHELLFNWKCVMAPSAVLDYIVVHEMCHMVYMNHSKEFWQMVKKVLPDYEARKELLRNYGVRYDL